MLICKKCNKEVKKFQKHKKNCDSCRYQQKKLRNKTYSVSVSEKQCFKCKKILLAERFYTNKKHATGLMTNCKECHKQKQRDNYPKRKNKIISTAKEYYENNKEIIFKKRLVKQKERYKNDPFFVLKRRLRCRLRDALRKKFWKKNTHFSEYIGCTLEELKLHIEKQFTEGMNWENQGFWHLDHKTPLVSATTEEELYKLCHYTNIQPLWGPDNLSKGSKILK